MKNEDLIAAGLHGTWTFSTEATADLGYYRGSAYLVMHFMADPMQPVRSCGGGSGSVGNGDEDKGNGNDSQDHDGDDWQRSHNCSEEENRACSYDPQSGEKTCVDTETSTLEWSDVVAYFQFGIHFRYGIAFKEYFNVDTSDWLGPYNIIMAETTPDNSGANASTTTATTTTQDGRGNIVRTLRNTFVSRYVETPQTASALVRPKNCTIAPPALFDGTVGLTALRRTIRKYQRHAPYDGSDPYHAHHGAAGCDHGDVLPTLPQIELSIDTATTFRPEPDRAVVNRTVSVSRLKVEYNILDLPDATADKGLYHLWPAMQKHLAGGSGPGGFPITGPYCFGGDPNRGYAVHLSYDSFDAARNATWRVTKDGGCPGGGNGNDDGDGVPCWNGGNNGNGNNGKLPYDNNNNSNGGHRDASAAAAMLEAACCFVGFLLLVSLVFNCQLSNRLKRMKTQQQTQQQPVPQQPQQPLPHAPPLAAFSGGVGTGGGGLDPSSSPDVGGGDDLEEPLLPPRGGGADE